ncbi:MAG TPA: glycosyltransferase family 4 protein, partial [Oscillatoriaceae cyanobacterium]
MNITCVISSLGSGGAERVISRLANAWVAEGHRVEMLTLEASEPFYALDPRITLRQLGVAGNSRSVPEAIASNLRRLWALRVAIRAHRPDVIVSFTDATNVRVLMAAVGLRIPTIVSERTDPAHSRMGRVWEFLRERFYPRADLLVMQTQRAAAFFPRLQQKIRIIPNPVPAPTSVAEAKPAGTRKQLVTLGRLHREKGFDLLMTAFREVAGRHPDWDITIWGEGPARAELERLRNELGLTERVHLPGTTTEAHAKLAAADLYVLSSRFEGFPNGLCEAMATGVPVVSFDCANGPAEIITPELDGVLVPAEDTRALAEALD